MYPKHLILLTILFCFPSSSTSDVVTSLSWLESYIFNRSQITSVFGVHSILGFPLSSIPQGSVLGLTLFSAFINDFPDALPSGSTVLFANDTTIFITGKDPELLNESLQSFLNVANSWMFNNGLKLNASRPKCMLIHFPRSRISPLSLDIQLGGCRIEQVMCFKCLGVLVCDTLCWSNHVIHITWKVSQRVNLLRRLSWLLPSFLLVLYLKSYIPTCVDYCDVVWDCCSKQDANRLQTLFNYACRIALHSPRLSSSSALWKDLHMQKTSPCSTYVQMPQLSCPYISIYLTCSMNHLTDTPPATAT